MSQFNQTLFNQIAIYGTGQFDHAVDDSNMVFVHKYQSLQIFLAKVELDSHFFPPSSYWKMLMLAFQIYSPINSF